jgi:hypothetical protein
MIAAVNGSAYGGGVEMILNCDIVIASEDAVFALPEVKRGVLAAQGGEPRPHQVILFPYPASSSSIILKRLKRGAGMYKL